MKMEYISIKWKNRATDIIAVWYESSLFEEIHRRLAEDGVCIEDGLIEWLKELIEKEINEDGLYGVAKLFVKEAIEQVDFDEIATAFIKETLECYK